MMKSVVCMEPGKLEMRQTPKPEVQPGQVLVKIRRIGICGTDIHAYAGNQPFFEYPRVLGHELGGTIEAVGEGVSLQTGEAVYVIPYIACGHCIACRRSKTNCCTDMQVLGVHVDGGMCEYLQVPAQQVVSCAALELDQLALVECLAIGAHAVRRAAIRAGSTVLVVGAGPIGMGVMQFAQAEGARVIMMDTNPERLAFCKDQLGADEVVLAGEDAAEELARLTANEFAETVFDATGSPAAMAAGFNWVAHGGNYIFVSVVKADVSFFDPDFHKREMSLLGSRNATYEDFEHVVACLSDGRVKAAPMITHRGTLDTLVELLPQWSQPGSGVIKAVVEI